VSPWRASALGGVLATLAYAFWLFPLLAPGPTAPDLGLPLHVLVGVQALALIVLLPVTMAGAGGVGLKPDLQKGATVGLKPDLQAQPAGPGPALLLAMVPWPLLALFAQGGLPMGSLLGTQGLILALALALWGLGRLAHLAPPAWRWSLVGAIQAAAILALVAVLGVPGP
jgi:hypothetical protein